MPIDRNMIRYRIHDILNSINEIIRITSKPFKDLTIDEKYAIRYNIIVLVESLTSISIHLCIEILKRRPSSYREAVQCASEALRLHCYDKLIKLVGLRNLLVHRYWEIHDEEIYEFIKKDFECLHEFLSRIESLAG